MNVDEAVEYVERYGIFFARDLANLPSGDETRKAGPEAKFQLWGYVRWGEDILTACVSFREWAVSPAQRIKMRAACGASLAQMIVKQTAVAQSALAWAFERKPANGAADITETETPP